jgi:hypothetical protein
MLKQFQNMSGARGGGNASFVAQNARELESHDPERRQAAGRNSKIQKNLRLAAAM